MIVTIARQFGSRGKDIGKLLADRLAVDFYDKELITMASRESGISEEYFEKYDEKASNSLLYTLSIGASAAVNSDYGMASNVPINDRLYLLQHNIIKKVADKPCVIVGRCADYVLADRNDLVSVFICADIQSRSEHIAQKYKISLDKALSMIKKNDKSRANYYNYYASEKWGDPNHYDLCLNSNKIGMENCVELLVSYLEMREMI